MLTIVTPTYNRAYILKNAFESLCRQTSFEFEWIIVDDGSTDNTEDIVNIWEKSDLLFSIIYIKQKNGGKHRAINKGVEIAKSDYILILDSDDFLTDDAVSKIHEWLKTIEGKENFAGVSGLKGWVNKDGSVGSSFDETYIDATNLERIKYNLMGDKAEVYKTSILKKYPFPEFEGENFLRESASWDRIAKDGYKIRWFNEIIYKCEYLDDGLTKQADMSRYKNNYQGFTYCARLQCECFPFPYNLFKIGRYYDISKKIGKKTKEIKTSLNISNIKLLTGIIVFKINDLRKNIKAGRK